MKSHLDIESNDDFFAAFIHELKTPVTSIKEALSLLSDINQEKLDNKTARIISIAQEEINRLVRMIDNYLKVTSIEAGKIRLQLAPYKLHDIINEVIISQSLLIQKKQMKIKNGFAQNLPVIFVDKDRVFEILANLLDNALKFSPEKGKITIQTRLLAKPSEISKHDLNPDYKYCKVTISDSGPGIPVKDLGRIFNKFERLKTPTKIRGIGLGLTIARNIVQLHNGKIWATSKKGKGSTFYFVLPIKPK
jgi:signal transduction histidine kinase